MNFLEALKKLKNKECNKIKIKLGNQFNWYYEIDDYNSIVINVLGDNKFLSPNFLFEKWEIE